MEILEIFVGIGESTEKIGSTFWKWWTLRWVTNESEFGKGEARGFPAEEPWVYRNHTPIPQCPVWLLGHGRCSFINVCCSGLLGEGGDCSEPCELLWPTKLWKLESLQSHNLFISSFPNACRFRETEAAQQKELGPILVLNNLRNFCLVSLAHHQDNDSLEES